MSGHAVPVLDWLGGVSAVACAALAWLAYFRWKDERRPEPLLVVGLAFLLGAASTGAAVLGYRAAEALGLPVATASSGEPSRILLYCLLVVGPVEEGAKFLAAQLGPLRTRAFDEEIDGLVYATAVALGFASVENLVWFPQIGWGERLARTIAAPLSHAVFSSVWGFGVGHARFVARAPAARVLWPLGTLALAAALHGLYDHLVLAHDGAPLGAVLVFLLWGGLAWRARRVVEGVERRLAVRAGRAPRGGPPSRPGARAA